MPMKLTGLIAASHTPMHLDGTVDMERVEQQTSWYQNNPIDGAFICGTTGEGKLLTVDERKRIAECWIDNSPADYPIIVHVGDESLEHCKTLAHHAQEMGAHAISLIAPNFYKPSDLDELVSFCQAVAESAPQTPFYYYHIPALTGVHDRMIDFLAAAQEKLPTLAGIKFSHNDLCDLLLCLRYEDHRYNILFGRDELMLAGLIYGIDGAVGSTYNYAAPLYQKLIEFFDAGQMERAREMQTLAIDMIALLTQYNEIAVGKAIMTWLGLNCGYVRRPLKNLSPDERKSIEHAFAARAFEPYLCKQNQLTA